MKVSLISLCQSFLINFSCCNCSIFSLYVCKGDNKIFILSLIYVTHRLLLWSSIQGSTRIWKSCDFSPWTPCEGRSKGKIYLNEFAVWSNAQVGLYKMKINVVQGPGIFFIIPCIDTYKKVDLRTVSFDVPPQEVRHWSWVMIKTSSMSIFKRDKVFIKVHPSSAPLCSLSQLILINGTRPVIGHLTMTKCWVPCKVQIAIRTKHLLRCLVESPSPWINEMNVSRCWLVTPWLWLWMPWSTTGSLILLWYQKLF